MNQAIRAWSVESMKQGPQGPHKFSSLELLKIQLKTRECEMKPSEMVSLSNSRWQKSNKSPNQFTNNGYRTETAKHYVVCE